MVDHHFHGIYYPLWHEFAVSVFPCPTYNIDLKMYTPNSVSNIFLAVLMKST